MAGQVPASFNTKFQTTIAKELKMSDDKSKTGASDRARISVEQHYERRDWARKFAVTEDELLRAVQKVGPLAADVEKELKKS